MPVFAGLAGALGGAVRYHGDTLSIELDDMHQDIDVSGTHETAAARSDE